ncbi:cupin domain-containing protein [Aquincola sp. S2]|uniref:Cupin domain-containing protein n=1 Tax=Pseudaquabacterium terrae TaxID=2732868 RepID=A0ABX2ETA7_9BURK|nr:cupin domain-containing protein [Aquabacterium terrae]NRF71871.1 cupin domain-containing protein [Aquabacterium terrae]
MTAPPPLLEALAAVNSVPLWDRYKALNTREPHPHAALHWPWHVMQPLVDRASREVNMQEAERRALLFTHPDWPGTVFTTPTLSGALQILLPGESAPPHRHTLAALRLVMRGRGAVTIVDGKRCVMEPGDLVLTPAWSWHEHVHEGDQPMVWFDGLDYPLARQLQDVFFEHGPGPMRDLGLADLDDAALQGGGLLPDGFPSRTAYSPLYRYPWTQVNAALNAMPAAADGSKRLRYTNPVSGGAVMPTIDCHALRLTPGATTRPQRSTATAMAIVIEGEGDTRIGEQQIRWKPHDVFTLPRWAWTEHRASAGPATIFLMSDREFLSRIDHLREEEGLTT